MRISINKFHKTKGELRKLAKENNIKLLKLLKYLRKRTDKRFKKEDREHDKQKRGI
ncbi:hypothetical protein ES705_26582 [subsurface metagenome]